MPLGYVAIVLHAHLPYIRHAEHDEFLEEDWLYEAITETYLPIIQVLEHLEADGAPCALTLSLTPPLLEMLGDPLLQGRYLRYLDRRIDLMGTEIERTRRQPLEHRSAQEYARRFHEAREAFSERYDNNLINAFRRFQNTGALEILTCAATHGFLPLMLTPNSVRAQVATGVRTSTRWLGRPPTGIWLPECAYRPGIDAALVENGITHFLVDAHGVLNGYPRPPNGVHAPVQCPSGAAAFGRDLESSKQVWSAEAGYPGDADYREFYRDLGYDGDYDEIRPYLHADGVRRNIGVKYHRVTGKVGLSEKQPYDIDRAADRAREHGAHFLWCRQHQVRFLAERLDCAPIVVAPYDAELFGHWWYEGPIFLEQFFRSSLYVHDDFETVTLSGYLERHPPTNLSTPSTSSWGDKGYFEVWLNEANDWIYRHLHHAEERFAALAAKHAQADDLLREALNQAARDLLLAQSSDWAFIMNSQTAVPYAQRRTREHLSRFNGLCGDIEAGRLSWERVEALRNFTPIFPDIDYRDWA